MFELWTKTWRRKRIVTEPIPRLWPTILGKQLWFWQVLPDELRSRLLSLIAIFLKEKHFTAYGSLALDDSIRVTVAGAACLMLLGFDDLYCFDRVQTVVVTPRPRTFELPNQASDGLFGDVSVSGLYTSRNPLVLSWSDVRRDCGDPNSLNNVVIHEFAHYVDDLDGSLAGDPPLQSQTLISRWRKVAEQEFDQLENAVARGLPTVIDPYGVEDKAEFFAVACEAFFCDPLRLAEHHEQLFELLSGLFRLDPRNWFQ